MPTLATDFQRATELHFAGRLDEAEQIYRQILAAQPNDPSAVHMLGTVFYQRGDIAQAEQLMARSLRLAPNVPEFCNNFSLLLRDMGRLDDAMMQLRRAIELNPLFFQAHDNIGVILMGVGQLEQAAAAFTAAINIRPDFAVAHAHLGWALWRMGKRNDAVDHWRTALNVDPSRADAHNGMCEALATAGQLEPAVSHGRAAVQLDPQNAEAVMNLGLALALQRRDAEALACLQKALQLQPLYVNAMINLAGLVQRMGDLRQAAELCRQALALEPGSTFALDRLSHALHAMWDLDRSVQAARQAVEIDPNYTPAWVNLASAQLDSGDFTSAISSFRKSLEIWPGQQLAHSNLLMALHYDPDVSRSEMFEEHRRYQTVQVEGRGIAPLALANDRNPDRPLRIAYVSPDFSSHPIASFLEPILRNHDRSAFTVSCYSDVRSPDQVTRRIRERVANWYDIAGMADDALARQIQANGEDILIDLAGHTANSRLLVFAFKPAPVQINYLGYLNTSGIGAMDYRLTDAVADPGPQADGYYTEKLIRLPCFFCYQPLEEAPEVSPLPATKAGAVTFGSLNHPAKINVKVARLWSDLLKQLPESRLVLTVHAHGDSEKRLLERFIENGIAAERIQINPRRPYVEYLAGYNAIDIALDPFPFNGHTTSCDALWMGVPVITMPGEAYASRTCSSILTNLEMSELIADSEDAYLKIAIDLANNLDRLGELRSLLRGRMQKSIICNAIDFTRHFEVACREAWRKWCEVSREAP
ncbi:MAG TPA: tetratricopeptide repeat protein [Tepidisphaeraceae bacterium]|nr:tetratricopeptide repeat protein [Tepidisphaeraceae bacterium]